MDQHEVRTLNKISQTDKNEQYLRYKRKMCVHKRMCTPHPRKINLKTLFAEHTNKIKMKFSTLTL